MSSRRATRRDRRKAKASGFRREGKKMGRVGHGPAGPTTRIISRLRYMPPIGPVPHSPPPALSVWGERELRVPIELHLHRGLLIIPAAMPPRKKNTDTDTATDTTTSTEENGKGKKPTRTVIRAKNPMDWKELLEAKRKTHWRKLRVTIQIREKLHAGKPANLKAADAMLKARGLGEFVAVAEDITDPVERAAAAAEVVETEGLCQFNRRDGKKGIWIPSNNVKAMLKENWGVLGLRVDVRGSRQALAEGMFVSGLDEEDRDWIYVGDKPDELDTSVTHSQTRTGPVTAIKRNEYVLRPKLTFLLMIANAESVSTKISDDELADTLVHASEHGLGANRSQGFGTFDVISIEEIEPS